MSFSGFNHKTNESFTFYESLLKIDDQINITVKEISSNSKPEKVKKVEPNNSIIEGKLKAYKNLKEELSKEGLI